jgi:hypothetical protein
MPKNNATTNADVDAAACLTYFERVADGGASAILSA